MGVSEVFSEAPSVYPDVLLLERLTVLGWMIVYLGLTLFLLSLTFALLLQARVLLPLGPHPLPHMPSMALLHPSPLLKDRAIRS